MLNSVFGLPIAGFLSKVIYPVFCLNFLFDKFKVAWKQLPEEMKNQQHIFFKSKNLIEFNTQMRILNFKVYFYIAFGKVASFPFNYLE